MKNLKVKNLNFYLATLLAVAGLYVGINGSSQVDGLMAVLFLLFATVLHSRMPLWILILSMPLGVFGSFQIGGFSLPILDLLAGLTLISGIITAIKTKVKLNFSLLIFLGFFIFFALTSFLINLPNANNAETIEASLYLIRLITYFSLVLFIPVLLLPKKGEKKNLPLKKLACIISISVLITIIFGFVQLAYFGDFIELELDEIGWDPHQNRLTSTWLDPNFLGGMLAFFLTFTIAHILEKKKGRIILLFLAGITAYALLLTYSRSAYLAAAISLAIITLLRARWLFVLGVAASLALVSTSDRAADRLSDFNESAKALMGEESAVLDPTARLRVESWKEAISLVEKNPIFGVGYGFYKKAQWEEGNLHDTDAHYASGSDSSILNIWATTGTLGLISFLAFAFYALYQSYLNQKNKSVYVRIFALTFLAGSFGWFAHSNFVNSLFFPLMLAIIIPTMSMALQKEK